MSLAPKVDEISEERVSEHEQARTKRKRKSESSMCAELQAHCKDLQSKAPGAPFQQFHPYNASMFTLVSPHMQSPLQLQVPTKFKLSRPF